LCLLDAGSEEFKDTKGVSKIRKSKKDRQHNGQKKTDYKKKERSTKQYTDN
jgi:hypothetical protein